MKTFWKSVRVLIQASAWISGIGILFMIVVTCSDIVMRKFGATIPGAYDLVRIAGGITIAAALPLTTAEKGHVSIEYFFHKLSKGGQIAVDSVMRLIQVTAFAFASYAFFFRGIRLLKSGEVMPTLQCHVFWVAWVISFMALLTAVISLFHLMRPGEELMRK